MFEREKFKEWLKENTSFTDAVIGDTVSRANRANNITSINLEETYQFYIEKNPDYKKLSVSVRSQMKRAISLYRDFMRSR